MINHPKKVLFESLDSDKDGKLNLNEINSGTDIGKEKVRVFREGCKQLLPVKEEPYCYFYSCL